MLILTVTRSEIMQGRHFLVARFSESECSYFPKHCVSKMENIYFFFNQSINLPQKISKGDGERRTFYLKSILDQVSVVHDKGLIGDFN